MGTNYYWSEEINQCEECGTILSEEGLHIGKSSAGWTFALHVGHPGIDSLDEWIKRWSKPGSGIVDEYGKRITAIDMYRVVTERSAKGWDGYPRWDEEKLMHNYAFYGGDGLLRRKGALAHPNGTYDYVTGEFS